MKGTTQMFKSQAKKLKPGVGVKWCVPGKKVILGTVTRKAYNTIWIRWYDDGQERTHYAEAMDYIFTQEQLDQMEEQAKVVESVKKLNEERIKTHDCHGKRRVEL